MNYATWKLNFTEPNYGTGPEDKIAELGSHAESAWVMGEVENGGTILGYVSDVVEEEDLSTWELTYITQEEALEFCIEINSKAYLLEDGKIGAPRIKVAI